MNKNPTSNTGKESNVQPGKKDLGREQVNTPKNPSTNTGRQSTETERYRSEDEEDSSSSSSNRRF